MKVSKPLFDSLCVVTYSLDWGRCPRCRRTRQSRFDNAWRARPATDMFVFVCPDCGFAARFRWLDAAAKILTVVKP